MADSRQIGFAGALFDDASLPVLTGLSQIVDTMVVGGQVVVQGGRLVYIDEEKFALQAQCAAERLLREAAAHTRIDYSRYPMRRNQR